MLKLMEKTIWMVKLYDVRRIANGLLVRTQSKDALLEKVERFKVWYCTDSWSDWLIARFH